MAHLLMQLVEIFDLIDSLAAENAADVAEKVKVLIDTNFPSIRKPSADDLKDAVMFSPEEVKDLGIMVLGNYTEAVDDDERLDIMSSLYALMLQLDTSTTK